MLNIIDTDNENNDDFQISLFHNLYCMCIINRLNYILLTRDVLSGDA